MSEENYIVEGESLMKLPQDVFTRYKHLNIKLEQSKGLVRLVNDLITYKPEKYKKLLKDVMNGNYSDFESTIPLPSIQLHSKLTSNDMKKAFFYGKYDHPFIIKNTTKK